MGIFFQEKSQSGLGTCCRRLFSKDADSNSLPVSLGEVLQCDCAKRLRCKSLAEVAVQFCTSLHFEEVLRVYLYMLTVAAKLTSEATSICLLQKWKKYICSDLMGASASHNHQSLTSPEVAVHLLLPGNRQSVETNGTSMKKSFRSNTWTCAHCVLHRKNYTKCIYI